MPKLVSGLLLVVALIHLLPLSGVFGAERLQALYGLDFSDTNLAILMRHRAVLFGMLGLFFLYAAFTPALQPLAFTAGFVSVVSFLVLAWSVGDYNAAIHKVFVADILALICLIAATGIYYFARD